MINNSYLLGLFGGAASYPTPPAVTAALAKAKAQPTPPWSPSTEPARASDLVRAALGGRNLINEAGAEVDKAGASSDYKKLFALYRGLESLQAMTDRATARGVPASELTLLNRRFSEGMSELSNWLQGADLEGVRLAQGTVAATSKTTAAVSRDSAVSITAPIHEGSPSLPNPAFEGDVRFDITIRTVTGTQTIAIDLADMGSTPRSLDAVIAHMNGRLEAAGVETRMGRQLLQPEPRQLVVGGRTVTLPSGPDRFALAVRGVGNETVGFQATAVSDAVYVVQATGAGTEVLKFQGEGAAPPAVARPGETWGVEDRAGQSTLPPGIEAVRASATGPDGSVWLVADLTKGFDNQPIKGERDVALIKLDSAGRIVSTHALGSALDGKGYAIAVDPNGRVAVAGSVVGALEPGQSGDVAGVSDSFVTVVDADGEELWTQRRGGRGADEATAVSFGADGKVYVAGRVQGGMSGASSAGGWDAYVQTFTETQVHSLAPIVATRTGIAQFGGAGDDGAAAIVVDGDNLYSAGVESGRLIVRRFSLDANGHPAPLATRDLGAAGGEVSGLSVTGGRLILTGTTLNGSLDVGGVTTPHHGGKDAFIATIDAGLSDTASDRLTYIGEAGNDTGATAKIIDGKVWISGVANRPAGAKADDPTQAYLARVDAETGAVEWRRTWSGDGAQATPLTLAVGSGGASVLDRLGLPQGEISQSQSNRLVDATSLRVGDRFYISPPGGGRTVAVTIDARDTLQTLARKIELASNRKLKITVLSEKAAKVDGEGPLLALSTGLQRLSITARDGGPGAILTSGEPGRDALAGLGLSQGYISGSGDKDQDEIKTFGLDLPRTLSLSSADAVKATEERLAAAMKAVRDAYRALAPESAASRASGPVPPYLLKQLSNYQAALNRLVG